MTPKLPLSDRLYLVGLVPSYTLTLSDSDRKFLIDAVREKEVREKIRRDHADRKSVSIFAVCMISAVSAALLIYGVP
jgi:hypothetical protein